MLVTLFLQERLEARGRVGALLHSHARQRRATRTQTSALVKATCTPSPLRLSRSRARTLLGYAATRHQHGTVAVRVGWAQRRIVAHAHTRSGNSYLKRFGARHHPCCTQVNRSRGPGTHANRQQTACPQCTCPSWQAEGFWSAVKKAAAPQPPSRPPSNSHAVMAAARAQL